MTLRSILYVFVCVSLVLGEPNPKSYIVGGRRASIETFPYLASLRLRGKHFCGASIISENCLLTAAHCAEPEFIKNLTIHVGTAYRQISGTAYKLRTAYVHDFDRLRGLNDIAIFKVYGPIVFNDAVQPVKLKNRYPEAGTVANIVGWGYVDTHKTEKLNQVQALNLNIISNEECKKYDPINPRNPYRLVTKSHVCTLNTNGKGTCKGDSGGPLVAGGEQCGVVSYNAAKCAIDLPDVFTDVSFYREWIYKICGV